MENELKHLTDTLLKVLDRYERHVKAGTAKELLEPHKTIIDGLMDKIRHHEAMPANVFANSGTTPRLGGQVPGPRQPQNTPQVIHGAPTDNSATQAQTENNTKPTTKTIEGVPTVPTNDIRPQVAVDAVTVENIDQMADALLPNDSPVEPVVETMKPKAK